MLEYYSGLVVVNTLENGFSHTIISPFQFGASPVLLVSLSSAHPTKSVFISPRAYDRFSRICVEDKSKKRLALDRHLLRNEAGDGEQRSG